MKTDKINMLKALEFWKWFYTLALPTTEGHEVMSMNSPDDVMLWLRSIGLNEYSRNFAEEQVNGANLLELCESDLIQLGMEKLGDRLTFMLERDMLNWYFLTL